MAITKGNTYLSEPAENTTQITFNTEVGGIPAGRLLIVGIALPGNRTITAPSGWQELSSLVSIANANGTRQYMFGRITGDDEPDSYTFTASLTASSMVGILQELIGDFDPRFPFSTSNGSVGTDASGTISSGDIQFYVNNHYAIGFTSSGSPASTAAGSMSGATDVNVIANHASSARAIAVVGGVRPDPVAAASIQYTWTPDAIQRVGAIVAINPPLEKPHILRVDRTVGGSGAVNVNFPRIYAGHLTLAFRVQNGSGVSHPTPSGWELLQRVNAASPSLEVYATTQALNGPVVFAGGESWNQVVYVEMVGQLAEGWLDDLQVSEQDGNLAAHDVAQVTSEAANAHALLFAALDNGTTTAPTFTTPTGWTDLSRDNFSSLHTELWEQALPEPTTTAASTIVDLSGTTGSWKSVGLVIASTPPEAGPARVKTSFGAIAGIEADPKPVAMAAASFGAIVGLVPAPFAVVPASIETILGAIAGIRITPAAPVEAEVFFGAQAGVVSLVRQVLHPRADFGAAPGLRIEFVSPIRAEFQVGVVAGVSSDLVLHAVSRVLMGAVAGFRDNYIGPGTGVVAKPSLDPAIIGMLDPTAHLREGDYQQAILPWRGVAGESGIIRILAMTVSDERRVPEFTDVEFSRTPDPASVRVLGRSGRVRKTIDQNTFASRMRRSDRER